MALIAIIFGIGITTYTTFQRRQTLANSSSKLVSEFRRAYQENLGGDTKGCDTLAGESWDGYNLKVISETEISAENRCDDSPTPTSFRAIKPIEGTMFCAVKIKNSFGPLVPLIIADNPMLHFKPLGGVVFYENPSSPLLGTLPLTSEMQFFLTTGSVSDGYFKVIVNLKGKVSEEKSTTC